MIQVYVEFLKDVLDTIQFSYEKEQYEVLGKAEEYGILFNQKKDVVKGNYERIQSQDLVKGFLEFLKGEYGDDLEVYLTLLDYIFNIVEDSILEFEYMKHRMEEALTNKIDIFTLLNLDMQIRALSWQNNIPLEFEKQWKINESLGEQLQKTVGFFCDKIPLQEREEDTIVVLTSQLLQIGHAPTRLVFDTAYRLKKYLKKNVVIINIAQITDKIKLLECGVSMFSVFNLCEEYNGAHEFPYKDEAFPMYQVGLCENNLGELVEVLAYIQELKPFCIWNIATLPAVLKLTNQITTNIYVHCTAGYAPIKTDIFYNYFVNADDISRANRKILVDAGVEVVDICTIGEREELCTKLTRETLGIPQDVFLIGVAGNRLQITCDATYFHMMDDIMEKNPQVHLIVIGKVTNEFIEKNTRNLKNVENIHFIGNRSDFLDCMSLIDLYANVFTSGGGTAGNHALFLGKPIVSLNYGDVYAFAGEEFAVKDVDEYIITIDKYINDEQFYQEKSKRARERYESLAAGDEKMAEVLQRVLEKVK